MFDHIYTNQSGNGDPSPPFFPASLASGNVNCSGVECSLLDKQHCFGGRKGGCRCLHFNLSANRDKMPGFNPCERFQSTMHRLRYGTIKRPECSYPVTRQDRPVKQYFSHDLTEALFYIFDSFNSPLTFLLTSSYPRPCPRGFSERWNFPQGSFSAGGFFKL